MYQEDIISTQANTDFMRDEIFVKAYNATERAASNRLISSSYTIKWRIHTLIWAAKHASNIQGDFVDFGGGFGLFSSAIIEYLNFSKLNKTYYIIDSFEGLKNSNLLAQEMRALQNYKQYGNWYKEVEERFKPYKNVKIIPGYVPEVLSELNVGEVSFVSIDFNCLDPEKAALKFIWDKVVKGGIIIFDDYAFPGHEPQKNAHDEFARSQNCMIYTCPTGQGILIKS